MSIFPEHELEKLVIRTKCAEACDFFQTIWIDYSEMLDESRAKTF